MTTQTGNVIPVGANTTGAVPQLYACQGAPVAAVNDVQTITVDSCTHSTLTLSGLPGGRIYTAAQDVSPAALATALNALLGASSVGVTGTYSAGAGGTYIITWSGGNYAGKTMALLGVSAVFVGGSSPAVHNVHSTPGVAATYGGVAPKGALLIDTTNVALFLNAGTQLVPVWNAATTASGELNSLLAAIPTGAVADLADPAALTAVPGSFADVAAVQTYLAGANVVPLIESRLENLEDKLNALLDALRGAGIIS